MTASQEKQAEAIACVEELNDLYYEQTKDEERMPFEFIYTNYWMGIKYFDETVWDDQDNDVDQINIDPYQEFDDPDPDPIYEPILDCVKRRVKKIHEITREFKLN